MKPNRQFAIVLAVITGVATTRADQCSSLNSLWVDPSGEYADFDLACGGSCSTDTSINAFAVYNGVLYAGGSFDGEPTSGECSLGDSAARKVARWSGTNWEALSPQVVGLKGGDVEVMLAVPEALSSGVQAGLYVGGSFQCRSDEGTGGNCPVSAFQHIARISADGTINSLAKQPDGPVRSMMVYRGFLCVGGSFSFADGPYGEKNQLIACWNGSDWLNLNEGLSHSDLSVSPAVFALEVFDEDGSGPGAEHLYAGGSIDCSVGNGGNGLILCDPLAPLPLRGLARWVPDNEINPLGPGNWEAVGFGVCGCGTGSGPDNPNALPGVVYAMETFDDGQGRGLFVGGDFCGVGSGLVGTFALFSGRIAKWTGTSWRPYQSAFALNPFHYPGSPFVEASDCQVRVLRELIDYTVPGNGPSLFIGGRFSRGNSADNFGNVARMKPRVIGPFIDRMGYGVHLSPCTGQIPIVRDIIGYGTMTVVGGHFNEVRQHLGNPIYEGKGISRWGLTSVDSDGDGYPNDCDVCAGHNDDLDSDVDEVPDGCDTCPGFPDDDDHDGDGIPFMCDNCPFDANPNQGANDCAILIEPGQLPLLRVIDNSGSVLESYTYSGSGNPEKRYRGDFAGTEFTAETLYIYQGDQVSEEVTNSQPVVPGHERRQKVLYDPNFTDEAIGRFTASGAGGGCGCGNGGKFRWRNSRGLTYKITTATLNPSTADVLELYTYEDESDRLISHLRRNSQGELELVEYRQYYTGIGACSEVVAIYRAGASCTDCYEASVECYNEVGLLTRRQEYLNPVALGQAQGPYALTEFFFESTIGANDEMTYYRRTEIRPSGEALVNEWQIVGAPYTDGSWKIIESYRSPSSSPNAERIDRRRERHDFNSAWGDYRLTSVTDPNGAVTTYVYGSEAHPRRVSEIRKSAPTGINPTLGEMVTTFTYYGNSARVNIETTTGPNGTVATQYTYDDFGQVLTKVENVNIPAQARTTRYRYNAFGEQDLMQSPGNLVHATVFDSSGRRKEE